MAITIKGPSDSVIDSIKDALEMYQAEHAQAEIDIYRQNAVSVRIRVVDPDFSGMDKADRKDKLWHYLEGLSEETQGDVSMLLALTPEEKQMSFANFEFDDPMVSRL